MTHFLNPFSGVGNQRGFATACEALNQKERCSAPFRQRKPPSDGCNALGLLGGELHWLITKNSFSHLPGTSPGNSPIVNSDTTAPEVKCQKHMLSPNAEG